VVAIANDSADSISFDDLWKSEIVDVLEEVLLLEMKI
jgi:hypothetical protein